MRLFSGQATINEVGIEITINYFKCGHLEITIITEVGPDPHGASPKRGWTYLYEA